MGTFRSPAGRSVLTRSATVTEVPRDAIQEVPGVQIRSGQEALRQEAAGIRRTVKADPQEEGQDDEEDRAAHGVPGVQAAHPGAAEAGEALRVGRRQEEEGADDPVLGCIVLPLTPVMFAAFQTL